MWTSAFDSWFDACLEPPDIVLWKPMENLAQIICHSPRTATGQSGDL